MAQMKIEQARVVRQTAVGSSYCLLELCAPSTAEKVRPGQFVHVKIPRLDGAVLRRPFSVFRSDGVNLSILFKPVGRGTDAMTALREGDEVSLLGPLGNGFPPCAPGMVPIVVAGGYGVAPLLFFASRLGRAGVAFLGGATAADILFPEEFQSLGWEVRVATGDGSRGVKGLVTDAFDVWLIEKGSRQGCFRPVDPKMAVMALLGSINWIARWYRPGGPAGAEEVTRKFIDLFMGGLLPRGRAQTGAHRTASGVAASRLRIAGGSRAARREP